MIKPAMLAGLGLVLAGCSAAPLPRLDEAVPATWRHTQGGPPARPDLKGWWTAFDDGDLDSRVERALQDNLALHEAAERLLAARELRAHSRDIYLPWIRGHAGDEIAPAATASYVISSFDASWEFGLFGRREGTRRSLQAAMDDDAAQFEGARVSLVAEVVADHLMLRAAQERLVLLAQIEASRARQSALLRVRRDLSLAAATEVDDSDVELGRARTAVATGRRQLDSTAQQLSVLLGREAPDPAWLAGGPVPTLKSTPPLAAPASLLRTRPEIRRAEAAVLQAAGERDLARGDQWPNVGLVGSVRWSTSLARSGRPSSTSYIGAVGPLVDIPLLDWGLRRARTAARGHLLEAAVYAYRDSVLHGIAEVEGALATLQAETEHVAQATAAVSLRQRATVAATKRTALRLGSALDAIPAEQALAEARLELVDAQVAQGMAYVALYKALGGAPLAASETAP